jgi:hypothetical protein
MDQDIPELVVRVGTPDDVHDVMELAIMGSKENGFVNASQTKMLEDVWQALNHNHGILGLIGPPGGKPEGAVLLRIVVPWYSDEPVIEERAIFIHPDYRSAKGGRASRMCEFSKRVSERMQLPLMIGVLSNQRTEAKVRLYKRHFGEPAGAYWLFNARTGGADAGTPSE